jgi:hypothetical protein
MSIPFPLGRCARSQRPHWALAGAMGRVSLAWVWASGLAMGGMGRDAVAARVVRTARRWMWMIMFLAVGDNQSTYARMNATARQSRACGKR